MTKENWEIAGIIAENIIYKAKMKSKISLVQDKLRDKLRDQRKNHLTESQVKNIANEYLKKIGAI